MIFEKQSSILGNSIEVMKDYPDNYFDLLVADLPRGNGTATEMAKKSGKVFGKLNIPRGSYPGSDWNNYLMGKDFFVEAFRISKNQIIFCAPFYLQYLESGTQWIVWRKLTQGDFGDVELAWTSFQGAHREFTFLWNGHQQGQSIKNGHKQRGNKKMNDPRIHPTQKPIKLYEWIYDQYAHLGDKIIDPTMGSGSSRIAAYYLGFEYVGIEKDPIHYNDHLKWWGNVYSPKYLIFN